MAELFQPKKPSGGNWLGVQPCRVEEMRWNEEKIEKFDWADVYIEVELDVPNSDYPQLLEISGSWKKDNDGHIENSAITYQIYNLAETLNIPLGLTIEGEFADTFTGEVLDDLEVWLNRQLRESQPADGRPYIVYVYQREASNGKLYNEVFERMYPNTDDGKKQLLDDVAYAKKQGWIKEANAKSNDGSTPPANTTNPLEESGLEQL